MFLQGLGQYYYILVGLQLFCAIHSYRRGTFNKWIWLIVLIPVIGCLMYIYSEILSNRRFKAAKIDVGQVFNPGAKIKKLENELRFTDTFANKVKLADAYLSSGFTENAIELYLASLQGAFSENEHVLAQLIVAYYHQQQYDKVIPIAKKIYNLQQFPRSRAHLLYAKSLENTGELEQAEKEFKLMKGRYSYFEQRYEYGLFLMRIGRDKDAQDIFTDMLNEEPHLGQLERKTNRIWFSNTREELRKLLAAQKTA